MSDLIWFIESILDKPPATVIDLTGNSNSLKTFKIITNIGSNKSLELLKDFIKQTLINNEKYKYVDATFVYQTKKDNRYIKKITKKKLNITMIDITSIFNSTKKNKYHYLPYIENGISLRGIDVWN